jgi:phage terminase small subunit
MTDDTTDAIPMIPPSGKGKGKRKGARAGLTRLQQRFCAEYVKDMNATQAAIRAGYSTKAARWQGHHLLTSPNIQVALADFQRELAAALQITPQKVLGEWAEIAFGNADDFIDREGRIDLSKPSRAQMGTISEITTETYMEGRGEGAEPVKKVRLKFHPKTTALDALSKHLGLFKADNEQKIPDTSIEPTDAEWEAFLARHRAAVDAVNT